MAQLIAGRNETKFRMIGIIADLESLQNNAKKIEQQYKKAANELTFRVLSADLTDPKVVSGLIKDAKSIQSKFESEMHTLEEEVREAVQSR